jgi:peptidyl-tRNA hydrolase, PTH1 family
MKLIVGLGNPGKEYAKTRHNAGFRVLDLLADKLGTSFDRSKFKGEYCDAALPDAWRRKKDDDEDDGKLLLVKPQTFMNLSGETVLGFSSYYKIAVRDILVVVDEVALPLGVLRMRRAGSAGGHNGLKDIALRLGSQEFARLRLGVGGRDAATNPERKPNLVDHVLGRFSAEEEEVLKKQVPGAVEACLTWAGQGVEAAMNKYNAGEKG